MTSVDIYIDGASKGNPGHAGIGVVISQKDTVLKNISNYIGEATSDADCGLPTDRLFAHWSLDAEAVTERLETGPPRRDLRKELKNRTIINHLESMSPGITISSPVKLNCTDDRFLFEIPYNLPEIKNRNLGVALEWQGKMRQVFRNYFKKGYAASDFWVGEEDGRLRAFYYLSKKK